MALPDPSVMGAVIATCCAQLVLRAVVREPGNLARRAAWLGMQSFAFSLCLGLLNYGSQATRLLSATTRWIAITQHYAALAAIYFAYAAYVFMAREHAAAISHARRHGYVLLAVLAAITIPAVFATPEDFGAGHIADYAHGPVSSSYLAGFTAYIAVMVAATAGQSWKWSRLTDEPWIRRGLALGALGFVMASVYCVVRATFIVFALTGHRIPTKEGAVTGWLIAAALPLIVIGLAVPWYGPRLSAAIRWWRAHRAHRALHPLWTTLTETHPHVRMTLEPSGLGSWLHRHFGATAARQWDECWAPHHRDIDLRLHLRVVQIWDARRALLDHCDRTDYDRAWDDLPGPGKTRAAHAEAAMLAAGLRRHRNGERLAHPEAVPAGIETIELAANVTWLQDVAREIRKQPPVR